MNCLTLWAELIRLFLHNAQVKPGKNAHTEEQQGSIDDQRVKAIGTLNLHLPQKHGKEGTDQQGRLKQDSGCWELVLHNDLAGHV